MAVKILVSAGETSSDRYAAELVAELRRRLNGSAEERYRYLGAILREAREPDVWRFTTPAEVVREWDRLEPQLGRRREFWRFLLSTWQELGLVG